MPILTKKSAIPVVLQVRNSDGSAYTSATPPTIVIAKDAAAQTASANTAVHKGNGRWRLALTGGPGGETDADMIDVSWSGSGLLTDGITIYTEADYTSERAGNLDYLDAYVSTRMEVGDVTVGGYGEDAYPLSTDQIAEGVWEYAFSGATAQETLMAAKQSADAAARPGAAMALTVQERNAIVTALLDAAGAIDGKTPREALRIMAAALAGELSGAATDTIVIKGLDGITTRIIATTDTDGNRSDIEYH